MTAPVRKGLTRAETAKAVSRAASSQPKKIDDKQRRLWQALNEFINREGAWIVSPPYASPARIEVMSDSPLPAKLADLGYQ
jgi:hypothetical protein